MLLDDSAFTLEMSRMELNPFWEETLHFVIQYLSVFECFPHSDNPTSHPYAET